MIQTNSNTTNCTILLAAEDDFKTTTFTYRDGTIFKVTEREKLYRLYNLTNNTEAGLISSEFIYLQDCENGLVNRLQVSVICTHQMLRAHNMLWDTMKGI